MAGVAHTYFFRHAWQSGRGDAHAVKQRKTGNPPPFLGAGQTNEAVIGLLRRMEPTNVEGLHASAGKARLLCAARDRVEAPDPAALQPITTRRTSDGIGSFAPLSGFCVARPASRKRTEHPQQWLLGSAWLLR